MTEGRRAATLVDLGEGEWSVSAAVPSLGRRLVARLGDGVPQILDLLAIAAATLAIGWYSGAFRGSPKGYDAPGHLAKIHLLLAQFPHVNWNAAWYSGSPSFVGSYPPGYHALVAVLARALHISPGQSMLLVAAASLLMIVFGLYGLVWSVTHSRLGGLVAAALVLAGPTQWGQILEDGLYPRLLGMGFAALALALAPSCVRRPTPRRLAVLALVLALAGSVHPLAGLLGGVAVAALMLVMAPEKPAALRQVVALGLGTFALAGFFYLPFFLGSRPHSLFDLALQPASWHALAWPSGNDLAAWSPTFLIALVAAAVLGALVLRRASFLSRGLDGAVVTGAPLSSEQGLAGLAAADAKAAFRVAGLLGAAGLAAVVYCIAGHLDHTFHYIQGLDPKTLLTYPEWLLAGACGIVVGTALRSPSLSLPRTARVASAVIAACCLAGFVVVVPILPAGIVSFQGPGLRSVEQAASSIPVQQQYRIVAAFPLAAEALNQWTTTPETGGYEDQAELNTQWQNWLTTAAGEPGWNARERLFLLDWYAGGWALLANGQTSAYEADRSHFAFAKTTAYVTVYRVRHPSPVVSLSAAPTALFVGDTNHYGLFLQALSEDDIASDQLVPLYGGTDVARLSPGELATADTVVLYGATDSNPAAADARLHAYVEGGGRLVVEQGDQGTTSPLPDSAPSLLPVSSTATATVDYQWRFASAPNHYVDRAELRLFSPADYGGTGAWQVVGARRLEPGAQPLLRTGRSVVLAQRFVGSGTVLWSGLNLPYHAAAFRNATESAVVGRLVGAAPNALSPAPLAGSIGPEQVTATGSGRGLLVKESQSPDWRATVDGRPAVIEMAGPGMMYIPLPAGGAATVVVSYHFSHIELAGIALSILAVLCLLFVLVTNRGPRRPERRRKAEPAGIVLLQVAPEQRRAHRDELVAALGHHDGAVQAQALGQLFGEPLEPYGDLLLRFVLLDLGPEPLETLLRLVEASASSPTSSGDLAALRVWVTRQREAAAQGLVHTPR